LICYYAAEGHKKTLQTINILLSCHQVCDILDSSKNSNRLWAFHEVAATHWPLCPTPRRCCS